MVSRIRRRSTKDIPAGSPLLEQSQFLEVNIYIYKYTSLGTQRCPAGTIVPRLPALILKLRF